ncbi:glutamate-5-semialdehyde dehydrogenase [bacterium]|nr:glutamate-5-semialdehyde dehydrogenase [bacterium]
MIRKIAQSAKDASRVLATLSTEEKNKALLSIANGIEKNKAKILSVNLIDIKNAKKNNLSPPLIDRLTLSPQRIKNICESLKQITKLPDPVGRVLSKTTRTNKLKIEKVSVPIGVIGIIYESRPNVTVDAASLCLKAGNAVILRGGKESINSNIALYQIMINSLRKTKVPWASIQMIKSTDRKMVNRMLKMDKYIDLIIPRGGVGLIQFVAKNSTIPVIKHSDGICHTYVDKHADIDIAKAVCFNAKVQRPGVCNAMETLLVHKDIADAYLPQMIDMFRNASVEIRGCRKTKKLVPEIKLAKEKDWATEYLDLILSIKIVSSEQEAINHIDTYGSCHSDAIITKDSSSADRFMKEVDSATVYVNSSTRFTDGCEFGLGAEIGISTGKLHARGPMGLEELTTYKYLIFGNGQVRI